MDRGTWKATVHGVAIESDMTERLNNNNKKVFCVFSLWIKWYKKIKSRSVDRINTKQKIATAIISDSIFWPYYGQNTGYVIISFGNLMT